MILVLFGPPGSGKGTQAEMLEEREGYYHLSTGEILREAMKKNTDLGEKAGKYVEEGALVPDEVIIGMVKEKIASLIKEIDQFLFDGFPRNLKQVHQFEDFLSEFSFSEYRVISLDVSEEEIMKRILGRRLCKNCGKNYNVNFNPPKQPGVCDECGGEVVKRPDDNEETVKERLRVYNEQTRPVLEYFSRKGVLITVPGEGNVKEIYDAIIRGLKE